MLQGCVVALLVLSCLFSARAELRSASIDVALWAEDHPSVAAGLCCASQQGASKAFAVLGMNWIRNVMHELTSERLRVGT